MGGIVLNGNIGVGILLDYIVVGNFEVIGFCVIYLVGLQNLWVVFDLGVVIGLVDFFFCVVVDGFFGDYLGRIMEVGIFFQNGDIIVLVVMDEVIGSFLVGVFIEFCIVIQGVDIVFVIVVDDISGGLLIFFIILCILFKFCQIIFYIIKVIFVIDLVVIVLYYCWFQESGNLFGGVEFKGIGMKLKIWIYDDDIVFKKDVILFGVIVVMFIVELCFFVGNCGGGFVGSNFSVEVVVKFFGE